MLLSGLLWVALCGLRIDRQVNGYSKVYGIILGILDISGRNVRKSRKTQTIHIGS